MTKSLLLILSLFLLFGSLPAFAEPRMQTREQYFEENLVIGAGAFVAVICVIFLAIYPRGIILGLLCVIGYWGIVALMALSHRDGGTVLIHHLQK